jgi:hypothetical protein
MITSLKFENFRNFKELALGPLARINLITGGSNIGKTSVLEGLYLLFSKDQAQISKLVSVFRCNISGLMNQPSPDDVPTFWQSLFHDCRLDQAVKISAGTDAGKTLMCNLSSTEDEQIRALFGGFDRSGKPEAKPAGEPSVYGTASASIASFEMGAGIRGRITGNTSGANFVVLSNQLEHAVSAADLYNQVLLRQGAEEQLLELLQRVDPRLQKLRYAKARGTTQPLVYAHFGAKNALSLSQSGLGFSRLFSLYCQMILAEAQVVLVDGMESGLAPDILPEVWRGIGTLAVAGNIQIFATTYSSECIRAAHEAMKALPAYGLAVHRIQRVKDHLEAVTQDCGMLEVALNAGMEVR